MWARLDGRRRTPHEPWRGAVLVGLGLCLSTVSHASEPDTQSLIPSNLTILESTPYSACLTWSLTSEHHGLVKSGQVQLQIIYRPVNVSYRVVADSTDRHRSAVLDHLRPATQYRLVMTSSVNGSLIGTSAVIFFHTPPALLHGSVSSSFRGASDAVTYEEISIIVIVLGVWIFAIVLFFNRWGKIRMLEPYEYNFKYHYPVPDLTTHRPSCPLAEPVLASSFEHHCSLERRLSPYSRRCSSLSAYLVATPQIVRNNSDPTPPQAQPRQAISPVKIDVTPSCRRLAEREPQAAAAGRPADSTV